MARYDERGFIIELEPDEIFVFGSNLAGRHGAGAAKQAAVQFGARYGVGEGLTGMCYAFPTLDHTLHKRTYLDLLDSVGKLYGEVESHPHLRFLLTKVGCGLGGYAEDYMKSLFFDSPDNLIKPEGWADEQD